MVFAASAPAQTWTESRVLEVFSQQSPQAIAARAQAAVARAEAYGRGVYSNPSFSYSREGAGFTEFYQAEQTLPVTGRIGILRRSAEPAAGAAAATAEATIWRWRAEARSAFYETLALQNRAEVLTATAADLQEVIRVLTAREKEGEGSRFDRLRWERELVEVRAEAASLDAQMARARGRLLEYLPQGSAVAKVEGTLVPPVEPPALGDLLGKALAARWEIRAANQSIARSRLEQQAAGRLRYPEPVIAAGFKRAAGVDIAAAGSPAERTQNGMTVGVTIPIPWFNRGQAEVARFQAEEARLLAERRAVEHEIQTQVTGAYQSLLLRREALRRYREDLGGRNEELLKIARAAYQEGAAGILELLDVFRLQRQSQQQREIDLGAAAREAEIELERAMGQEVTK